MTNIYKELLSISLPLVFSAVSNSLLSILAIPILGFFSIEAMAVASIYAALTLVFNNVLFASFTGYRILGSKAVGKDNSDLFKDILNSTFLLCITVSIILGIITYIFGDAIIHIVFSDPNAQALASRFITIASFTYLPLSIIAFCNITFNLHKRTKTSMYITMMQDILGLLLSVALVYGIGDWSGIGADGVAYSALITYSLVAIFAFSWLHFSFPMLRISKFRTKGCDELFKLSYPAMISMFFDYFATLLVFLIIGSYINEESIAAFRIASTFLLLYFTIITAFSSGFMILGGRALGERQQALFTSYYTANRNLCLLIAISLAAATYVASPHLASIFTKFSEVSELTRDPLMLVGFMIIFSAISYTNAIKLRLLEKVKLDMALNLSAIWLVQLPLTFVLLHYYNGGLISIFYAMLVYDIVYAIATQIAARKYRT